MSVSDLREAFLSRTFAAYVDCYRCHAVLKLRRTRAITIGLSESIGVIFLGGWFGGYFLSPVAQGIYEALAAMLLLFAYVRWAPPLCGLELGTLPGQARLGQTARVDLLAD
jgi:hypothetical protein